MTRARGHLFPITPPRHSPVTSLDAEEEDEGFRKWLLDHISRRAAFKRRFLEIQLVFVTVESVQTHNSASSPE